MQKSTTIAKTVNRSVIVSAVTELNELVVQEPIDTDMNKLDLLKEIQTYLSFVYSDMNFSSFSWKLFKKMGWEESSVPVDISFYGLSPIHTMPIERVVIDTFVSGTKCMSLWRESDLFGITSEFFKHGIVTERVFVKEEVAMCSFQMQSHSAVPFSSPIQQSHSAVKTEVVKTEVINYPVQEVEEAAPKSKSIENTPKTRKDAVIIALQSEPETLADWISAGSDIYSGWGRKDNLEEQKYYTLLILEGMSAAPASKSDNLLGIIQRYRAVATQKQTHTRVHATTIAIKEGLTSRLQLIERSAEIYSGWGKKGSLKSAEFYVDTMLTGVKWVDSMTCV